MNVPVFVSYCYCTKYPQATCNYYCNYILLAVTESCLDQGVSMTSCSPKPPMENAACRANQLCFIKHVRFL